MDIAQVSMAMSAAQTQQQVSIAVMKNEQDFTEQTAQQLIEMMGASSHKVDIEV